jgi:hypothetical protein
VFQKCKVGPPGSIYGYPKAVLAFIRALEPGDINGGIKEVNMQKTYIYSLIYYGLTKYYDII